MKPTPSVDSLTRGAVIAERTVGPFRFVQSAYGPGAYLSAHSHDISKISLILAGGTEERHRNSDDRFGPGSVVIKPKYATHANSFSPGGMQGFAVSVDYHGSEVDSAWSAATQQYRWINVREITRAMFELSRLVFADEPAGQIQVLDLFATIVGYISNQRIRTIAAPEWLRKIRKSLHDNAAGQVSIADVSVENGKHPVYVARAFRQYFGCSMSEFITRKRVEKAAELLAGGNRPAVLVALDSGFADHAHLCRVFRSYLGVSPGKYQRSFCSKRDARPD